MTLENWLKNTWLKTFDPTLPGIQKLFQVVDRDLADAQVQGLTPDGCFQHAYDAALQLCVIALNASGYAVPKGASHHMRNINSLQYTLGSEWSDTQNHLDRCSRLRGQSMYEQIDVVSEEDANDLIETAQKLRGDVIVWLKETHPELVPLNL